MPEDVKIDSVLINLLFAENTKELSSDTYKEDLVGSVKAKVKTIDGYTLKTKPPGNDGWKTAFLLGWTLFRCYVSFGGVRQLAVMMQTLLSCDKTWTKL